MTQQQARHVPVLLNEAMDFLSVRPDGTYVDCTLGLAGHAESILRRLGPAGRLIGFDRDPEALELARARLDRVREELESKVAQVELIGEAFSRIAEHVKPASIDGLLADFGVSSLQFDEGRRGFSFQADGPLDMRMDTRRANRLSSGE
jgi:16S rRNA (cytosine1402-N4)-methyltransferase